MFNKLHTNIFFDGENARQNNSVHVKIEPISSKKRLIYFLY